VLGEHHDARARVLGTDAAGQVDALRGVGRGHPDVEDDHVRGVGGEQLEQLARVTDRAEDLEAVDGVQDGASTLAHQVVVLSDQQRGGHRSSV
jgi:hypothetical protein